MICCLWHVPTLPVSSGVVCMFRVKCKWIGLHEINDFVRIWVKRSGWYTTTSCAGHQISTNLLLENILEESDQRIRIRTACLQILRSVNVPQDEFYLHLPLCWQQAALRCSSLPPWVFLGGIIVWIHSGCFQFPSEKQLPTTPDNNTSAFIHSVCNGVRNGSRLDQQSAYISPGDLVADETAQREMVSSSFRRDIVQSSPPRHKEGCKVV